MTCVVQKVTYCTSCCRWDGSTKDPTTGRWMAGSRDDNCNVGNGVQDLKKRLMMGKIFVIVLGVRMLHLKSELK